MAPQYGEVRVDYITYTTGVVPNEGNATAYVSGLINNPTFSGNVIIEGNTTIDGNLNVSGDINASGVVISGITGLFDDGTEAAPSIAFASDPDTGIYKPVTNEIGFSTNGGERLRIDNTGKVGIGTDDPAVKLHVSAGTDTESLRLQNSRHTFRFDNVKTGTGPDPATDWSAYQQVLEHGVDSTVQEFIKFGTGNDDPTQRINLGTGGSSGDSDLMHLVTDKVGIGTSSPSTKLEVNGNLRIAGGGGDTGKGLVAYTEDSGEFKSVLAGYKLAFFTGGNNTRTEAVRINHLGNVGIGTVSPENKLTIDGGTGVVTTRGVLSVRQKGDTSEDGISLTSSFSNAGLIYMDEDGKFNLGTTISAQFLVTFDTTTGNVGIGTSTPGYKLEVQGAIVSSQSTGEEVKVNAVSGAGYIGTKSNHPLYIQSNNSNRITVLTNGNVGIGKSTPAVKLHVAAGTDTESLRLENSRHTFRFDNVKTGTGTDWNAYQQVLEHGVDTTTQEFIKFGTGNDDPTTRINLGTQSDNNLMHLVANKVGIGTASPSVKLDVDGTVKIRSAQQLQLYNSDNTSGVSIQAENTTNVPGLTFNTYGAERMRIDSSGRLVVGHSSAVSAGGRTARFQIHGTAADTAGQTIIRYSNNTVGPAIVLGKSRNTTNGQVSGGAVVSGDSLGYVIFGGADGTDLNSQGAYVAGFADGTPSTDRIPGRIGFFTTPTGTGAYGPEERMRIGNDGAVDTYGNLDCLYIRSGAVATTSRVFISGRHTATSTQTGTESFKVTTDGNVSNTNNSYGALSDIKLKENIVDANSQWDDLKALQVRNYNFKEGQTHTQLGLIAQEVELVTPGLVSESPDCDEEGNDLGTVTKSVNYSVLYMKAVKALQEAMERIENLEQRLTDADIA